MLTPTTELTSSSSSGVPSCCSSGEEPSRSRGKMDSKRGSGISRYNSLADEAFGVARVLTEAVWEALGVIAISVGQILVVGAMRVSNTGIAWFQNRRMARIEIQSGRRSVGSMVPIIMLQLDILKSRQEASVSISG